MACWSRPATRRWPRPEADQREGLGPRASGLGQCEHAAWHWPKSEVRGPRSTLMMPVGKLVRMVAGNTARSRRHFILSAFGIVIGIATFVIFLASTEQVAAVLEKIFPVEQVQVVAPRA